MGLAAPMPGGRNRSIWTSLRRDDPAELALALNVLQRTDLTADDLLGNEFAITNILAHEVELANEKTGEVNIATRVVLIAPTGKSAAFVSKGVYSAVCNIVAAKGNPPYDPPVRVVLRKVKAKVGKLYVLEVLG